MILKSSCRTETYGTLTTWSLSFSVLVLNMLIFQPLYEYIEKKQQKNCSSLLLSAQCLALCLNPMSGN